MIRKFTALLAACAVAFTALAPATADARERRHDGYYNGRDHGDYGRRGRYRDRHDDRGDAVAAGVVGLVLGLAIGSLASQPRDPQYRCRDTYQRCAPPPRQGYSDQRGYDPRYDEQRSAYEQEYGLEGGEGSYDPAYEEQRPQCVRRERQWDRYANRYVVVDVPC